MKSTARAAAEGAADRKDLKYQSLPLTFNMLGPINSNETRWLCVSSLTQAIILLWVSECVAVSKQ